MEDISGDMYYVKYIYKTLFKKQIEKGNLEWSGINRWRKYPKFLKYRKCDFSGEEFKPNDRVYCVYVIKLK